MYVKENMRAYYQLSFTLRQMLTYERFFNAVRNHSSIGIPHFHSDLKVEDQWVYTIPRLLAFYLSRSR
jgi:hypothetical protein